MEASEAEWDELTEVTLAGLRRFCRAVLPGMAARGWGRIVNMSSLGGMHPTPLLLASHALSAAVNAFTRGLAREVAGRGVLVNAVAVGPVMTESWRKVVLPALRHRKPEFAAMSDDELAARLAGAASPLGRFATPEEVAPVVAFLASARNAIVTGTVIEAAGGAERFL
jgi:3-oxoacyl-[acyl-carrier protein] reductase